MSFAPPPGGPPPGGPAGYYGGPPQPGYGSPPPMPYGGPPAPHHQHTISMPPGGAPAPPVQTPGGGFTVQDTIGSYEGVNYRIDHRDSNSILHLTLHPGYDVKGKPGSMVTMQPTVQIKGSFKFSLKKMVTGGEMAESSFTGPGEVVLAPEVWGDIVPVRIDPGVSWSMGKDAFLACTRGVSRTGKAQGIGKAMFSGEGFFISKATGQGILFAQSLGAIIKRTLARGEQLIVDNGHLVCWSASYAMERINTTGGGLFSGMHTGEGLVCRFTGPGDVYIQTRNPESLGQWISSQVAGGGGGGHGGGGGNLLSMLG